MTLPCSRSDREYQSFVECGGSPARRTKICQEAGESIKVEVVDDGDGGSVKNFQGSSSSVPSSTPTTVVSLTVPVGKTFFMKQVEVSSTNRSTWIIKIAGTQEAKKRIWDSRFNETFDFFGIKLSAGTTIDVIAEHARGSVGDFDARIIGNEV